MQCDMCGKEENLYKTKIEDSFMNVCRSCATYGTVIEKFVPKKSAKKEAREIPERKETIQIISKNFSKIVKQARENLGLKQKDFAQKIAEKESVIHKIESGNLKPSIKLARKLEKFLDIILVEQYTEKNEDKYKTSNPNSFTIADVIKIKKR